MELLDNIKILYPDKGCMTDKMRKLNKTLEELIYGTHLKK